MVHATIRDVAREAAVSVASVSRVLNGHEHVRPEMKQRVEAAATALGYVMHAGARSLSLSRTNAIGVVLPDLHGEFFSELLRGMDRAASASGLQLLLSNMHGDARRAVDALRTMRGRVDGMIVLAPHVDADLLFAQLTPSVPAVLLNCAPHQQRRAELRVDNVAAAAAMVHHLVATGCRRIVHLAGAAGNIEAQDRQRGYEQAIATYPDLVPRVLAGDFLEESGIAAAEELLRNIGAVDAVFAANDMMAIGVLVTLHRAGVAVPDQVSVAGFDDIPLARLISPALTTMRVDIAGMGARAVDRLVELIAGRGSDDILLDMPELVPRATTRPLS
jgi:LacI family transcriptional regulator